MITAVKRAHTPSTHSDNSIRANGKASGAALFSSDLCSRPLSLSPTLTTMTSLPAPVRFAISLLMVLATPEWMAPHRPRSEVTPMIKCLADLSSGALMSAFSYNAGQHKNNNQPQAKSGTNGTGTGTRVPRAPLP